MGSASQKKTPQQKSGNITLLEALLLLAQKERGPDWPGNDLRKYLPLYPIDKVKGYKSELAYQFVKYTISSDSGTLKFNFTTRMVSVAHKRKLHEVVNVLLKQMTFLISKIGRSEIVGTLYPNRNEIIKLDRKMEHVLKSQKRGAFCTNKLLIDIHGVTVPAQIKFETKKILQLSRTNRRENFGNQYGTKLTGVWKDRLDSLVKQIVRIVEELPADQRPRFSRNYLAKNLADIAQIQLRKKDTSIEQAPNVVAVVTVENYLVRKPELRELISEGGRPKKANSFLADALIENLRQKSNGVKPMPPKNPRA